MLGITNIQSNLRQYKYFTGTNYKYVHIPNTEN